MVLIYGMPETDSRVPLLSGQTLDCHAHWTWPGAAIGTCDGRNTMLMLCVGSTILVPIDWAVELGMLNRMCIQVTRAAMTLTFLWYILRTGVRPTRYGFGLGLALSLIAILIGLHAAASPTPRRELYDLARTLYWVLGAIVVYRLSLTGELSERIVARWIGTVMLFGSAFTIAYMLSPGVEVGQNASAYLVLWCMPTLLMLRTTRHTACLMAVGAIAILLTVKRGAVVGLAASGAAWGLAQLHPGMPAKRFTRIVLVFAVVSLVGGIAAVYRWEELAKRFSDTSGSGRNVMYTVLIEHWWRANTGHFVLGFGAGSVPENMGRLFASTRNIEAHSDWVKFIHDYGLVGLCCLLFLHLQFLHLIRRSQNVARPLLAALSMGYVIMFLVNIYSGILYSPAALYLGVVLGVSSARIHIAGIVQGFDDECYAGAPVDTR